jgi:hypothetical protein
MTNREFIKHLEYHERVMRELHGVKVALPFKVALESAKAVVETDEKSHSGVSKH